MFPGDSSRSRENYRRSFLGNIAFHEPGRAHKNSARGLPTFEGKNSFGWKKGHRRDSVVDPDGTVIVFVTARGGAARLP